MKQRNIDKKNTKNVPTEEMFRQNRLQFPSSTDIVYYSLFNENDKENDSFVSGKDKPSAELSLQLSLCFFFSGSRKYRLVNVRSTLNSSQCMSFNDNLSEYNIVRERKHL